MSMKRLIEGLEEAKQPKQGGVHQQVLDRFYLDSDNVDDKFIEETIKAFEPIVMMKVWGVKDYSKFSPYVKSKAESWHEEFFDRLRVTMREALQRAAPFESYGKRWQEFPSDFYEK